MQSADRTWRRCGVRPASRRLTARQHPPAGAFHRHGEPIPCEHQGRGGKHVEHVVVRRCQDVGDSRCGIQPEQCPQQRAPHQCSTRYGRPHTPADVQRRQRCVDGRAVRLDDRTKRRNRRRDDVVIAGQQPRRGHRVAPECHQARCRYRDQRVAVQPERVRPAPDEQHADDTGQGTLHHDVIPGGGQRPNVVGGDPVVHHEREGAAHVEADGVDRERMPHAVERRARPQAGRVIQAPQHEADGKNLQKSQRRMPGTGGTPHSGELAPVRGQEAPRARSSALKRPHRPSPPVACARTPAPGSVLP